jgi:hypothetical protein
MYYICVLNKQTYKMKKIFLLLATPAVLFLAGCGDSKTEEIATSMPGMMEVELKINGNALSIMVPDSTKGKMEIVEQSWGATEIQVGKDFQISIEEGEGDVALMKSDIAGNDVNKFKRFVKDEPTLLFWESEITTPEFHFYSIVKPGTVSYIVKDIAGEMFGEKAVEMMVESAKTLKAKDAPKPEA